MTFLPDHDAASQAGALLRERRRPVTSVDPVCAMSVDTPDAPRLTFNGVEYRFCSEMCRRAFAERPGRYLKNGDSPRFDEIVRGGTRGQDSDDSNEGRR